MDGIKRILKETLDGIRAAVGTRLYRQFLQVMDFAVRGVLGNPNPSSVTWFLQTGEKYFATVAMDTDLAMQLALMLGYENSPLVESDDGLVLLDVRGNFQSILAFHLLAEEELRSVSFGGLAEIQLLYDKQSLVAFLSHFFHLNFEFLLLTTPSAMLQLFDGDIRESAECVEILCDRLHIMKTGSNSRASWKKAKEVAFRFLDSEGQSSSLLRLKDLLGEVGDQLTRELSTSCPRSLVHLFLHLHMIRMTIVVSGSQDTLAEENVSCYFNSFYGMSETYLSEPCLSERYKASSSVVQDLLLKSMSESLTESEIRMVFRQSVWQAVHFIDHFGISERKSNFAVHHSPLSHSRCAASSHLMDEANQEDENETEKTDAPERLVKDEDGNESSMFGMSSSSQFHDFNLDLDRRAQLDTDIRELINALSDSQLPAFAAADLEAVLRQKQEEQKQLTGFSTSLSCTWTLWERETISRFLVLTLRHVRSVRSSIGQLMCSTLPFLSKSHLCVIGQHLGTHFDPNASHQCMVDEIGLIISEALHYIV